MPKTAYSIHYERELDAYQLVSLYSNKSIKEAEELLKDIPANIRTLVGVDIVCSSCGASGAIIVSGAHSKASKEEIRKAHFRFKGENGEDTHREFCEFAIIDDDIPKLGGEITLDKARNNEQKAIRELVCKAIELKLINQSDIRSMRQWYFDTKTAGSYQLELSNEPFKYLSQLMRTVGVGGSHHLPHHPSYGQLPSYDWDQAAVSQLSHLTDGLRRSLQGIATPNSISEATKLIEKYKGKKVFDVTALEPYYKKTLQLCAFSSRNVIKKPKTQRYIETSNELLAFCSLILSISDWNFNAAVDKLVKIASAPSPRDLLLGNIIGLNPFHDYNAWRLIKLIAESHDKFDFASTPTQQLAKIKSSLIAEYFEWRTNEGLPEIVTPTPIIKAPIPSSPWQNNDDVPF